MTSRDPVGTTRIEAVIAAGQSALEDNRFEAAANHFRSALRMGTRTGEEEAIVRCSLSEALEKRGLNREQLEAVTKYDKFGEFARLSEQTQMVVLTRLGWGYSFNNDIPRAIALFNQAIQIARRLDDQAGMGECYFGLGRAYRNLSEIHIARDYYTSALEHFRRTGDWRKLAESYIYIGYINGYEGDFRGGQYSLKQALAIIGDKDEPDLVGRAHMYLALNEDNLGATDKALASWEKCLELFRRSGNAGSLAINQNNLATKLIWLGEWPRAEQLVKQALEELSKTSMVAQYASVIDTLALLYVFLGRLDEADRLLEQSLEVISTVKSGEWIEVSTQVTLGRSYLVKGNPEQAIKACERAIEISMRTGNNQFLSDARLWLSEALLETGRLEEARKIIESVQAYLNDSPNLLAWGLMMRMVAKMGAADNHIAAAIQSLSQSTSIFEIRGNIYACAVNRLVYARMLERQRRIKDATAEVEAALKVFKQLGAAIDERTSIEYLESLKKQQDSAQSARLIFEISDGPAPPSLDLASALDGFAARRLVQASVSRDLLLHELAAIAREQSASDAAIVVEIISDEPVASRGDRLRVAASSRLDEEATGEKLDFLSELEAKDYSRNFVYPFTDKQQSKFLLYLISPKAERFLASTVNLEPLLSIVQQGLENHLLRSKIRRTQIFDPARLLAEVALPGFICASRAMSHVLEQIHKIRSSDVTVLITGESGTGKELIARAVHAGSSRRYNTFLPFNCSASPHDMIESQLFGYRKGSFTGAVANYEGVIRAAERGTLFLDEIGDLPLELQPKLLRFLQEGEIHPIGESQPLHVDVRVVAATNSELERAVSQGKFREDLFHRLNVIRIKVPALRQRREEIPALINHYLTQYQQESAKSEIRLSEEAVDLMVVYDWPGNVRQLCNEVRRIVAYSESGSIVTTDVLSPEIVQASRDLDIAPVRTKKMIDIMPLPVTTISEATEELERRMIQDALQRSSGNIARAAKELGLSRKGLYLKMDRLNFKV